MSDESRIVFLHHGLFGFANAWMGSFRTPYFAGGIERSIRDLGHVVLATQVHPTAGIEARARTLKSQILQHCRTLGRRTSPVTIIAHSLGGLDARHMITHLGMGHRIDALITISTPHRGSPYADWVFETLGERLRANNALRLLRLNMRAVADMRVTAMQEFNERTPDDPNVRYGSVATVQTVDRVSPFLRMSHGIVLRREGENDGVVSVKSAIWGEHLATWQTDHFRAVNRRFTPVAMPPGEDVSHRYAELVAGIDAMRR